MAFNFAHLLSAACGGAPRRLGRLRRPPGRWQQCVHAAAGARYTTGALWRAPGEHDYAVVASTRERVASIFTKTLGVPSAASIRSDVTVPGALAAQLRVAAERRPRLSSRRRGAEGWPTGGAVLLPAPPIGQPSDRSIGAQSRFRSEKAAGAAADPSRDASSFLCSPMRREATRRCSARRGRRRLRRARVGRSGGTLCARHLPAPRRQPSRRR